MCGIPPPQAFRLRRSQAAKKRSSAGGLALESPIQTLKKIEKENNVVSTRHLCARGNITRFRRISPEKKKTPARGIHARESYNKLHEQADGSTATTQQCDVGSPIT